MFIQKGKMGDPMEKLFNLADFLENQDCVLVVSRPNPLFLEENCTVNYEGSSLSQCANVRQDKLFYLCQFIV